MQQLHGGRVDIAVGTEARVEFISSSRARGLGLFPMLPEASPQGGFVTGFENHPGVEASLYVSE